MRSISSFKEIVSNYDYFLFDQWGVLHNGSFKFPFAEKCLKYLKKENKKIVLVSNSSRPTDLSIENLENLGIKNKLYDYCITSGQIALNFLEKDIYSKYGKNVSLLNYQKKKKSFLS